MHHYHNPDLVKDGSYRVEPIKELLKAVEPTVQTIYDAHLKRSKRWYPHEVIPWGNGVDYREVPWKEGQSPLRPDVVLALETNLLTEDNLPFYHSMLEEMFEPGGVWTKWSRRWTAEEGTHASTIRDYMYLMRVMDPKKLEDDRIMVAEAGFPRQFATPFDVLTYTAIQEIATRESHLRTGQKADEPIALELLTLISRDESFHFAFYQQAMKAALDIHPDLILPAIERQFYTFEMPGIGMDQFALRKATIENAGIFGTREHRDLVIKPLIKIWKIDTLEGLSPAAQASQERILKIVSLLDRLVKRQERRPRKSA